MLHDYVVALERTALFNARYGGPAIHQRQPRDVDIPLPLNGVYNAIFLPVIAITGQFLLKVKK